MKNTPAAPPTPDNHPHRLRTLVVDDSVMFLEDLCAYLTTEPLFQVVGTALDGGEALHMVDLLEPDLVIMDLLMPFMDGLQATVILRRRVPNMRIIIMTREHAATAKVKARAHGAHGFIRKPGITDGLITEVRQVFHSGAREGRAGRFTRTYSSETALETTNTLL